MIIILSWFLNQGVAYTESSNFSFKFRVRLLLNKVLDGCGREDIKVQKMNPHTIIAETIRKNTGENQKLKDFREMDRWKLLLTIVKCVSKKGNSKIVLNYNHTNLDNRFKWIKYHVLGKNASVSELIPLFKYR